MYVHEGGPGLGKEGIVLARKEKCRRWQPLMIINLFRPPTNRRLKTGSGLGGGKYPLISPHERSTLAPVNNPDLSCHILTSSPSFQIGFLPCRLQYHHHLGVRLVIICSSIPYTLPCLPGHDILLLSYLNPPQRCCHEGLRYILIKVDLDIPMAHAALSTVYRTLNSSRTRLSLLVSVIPCTIVDGHTRTRICS